MPNPGIPFDEKILENIAESKELIQARIIRLQEQVGEKPFHKQEIEKAISVLDLTTLQGDDTEERVTSLLQKAQRPLEGNTISVAAVCLYQPFVAQAVAQLKDTEIKVATVAGGFPAGQMAIDVKCSDIQKSVELGATEIDAVINRSNPLTGNWDALYNEVRAFKTACGLAKLKVIIATGELGDYTTIAKTSWVCMMAGADFIKTSTGLEKVNATLEAGYVMLKTIREYEKLTGFAVGFKPAGGIRTTQQAMEWFQLVREELGEKWADKSLFRIGASSLLDDLLTEYKQL